MVDRIELTVATNNKSCEVITYRNLPPPIETIKDGTQAERDQLYNNYQDALSRYVTFLRISAILYTLQKHGDLILSGTNVFVPFDVKSAIPDQDAPPSSNAATPNSVPAPAPQSTAPTGNPGGDHGQSTSSKSPGASDMINAWNKNAVWEKTPDGWVLGQKAFKPVFYLNHYSTSTSACDQITIASTTTNANATTNEKPAPDIGKIECDIANDEDLANLSNRDALLKVVLENLQNGFSISDSSNTSNATIGPCPNDTNANHLPTSHLVMRSLLGLMAAAAQEQVPFEALIKNNPTVPPGPEVDQSSDQIVQNGPKLPFLKAVPDIEMIPLLSLVAGSRSKETSPVIAVEYRGKRYEIADVKTDAATENEYWDRDVFRLIDQLTSQVTVDISKFPLTTILQ